jgi:hypothetical protein
MVEMLGDAVCGLHRAQGDEDGEFLGFPSKLRSTVSPSFVSQQVALGFSLWASKRVATVW